jgi:putative spermidine/putrescine transport system permease protein
MARLFARWLPRHPAWLIGQVWLWLLILFIYAPLVVVMGASIDPGQSVGFTTFLQFPPRGFSLRWYGEITPQMWSALWLSLRLATLVGFGALVVGFPTALGLTKSSPRLSSWLEALFRVPLQIPFIVTSVALLQAFYALSTRTGIVLAGGFWGLCLGHLFVAAPYAIGSIVVSLRRLNPRLEDAAASLGLPYWRILLRVTLPLAAPGVFGGVLYAFLISFTDVTLAIFLSGPGLTPFPVWVVNALSIDLTPSLPAISTLVLIGSLVIVYLLQRLLGMETISAGGDRSG